MLRLRHLMQLYPPKLAGGNGGDGGLNRKFVTQVSSVTVLCLCAMTVLTLCCDRAVTVL